MNLDGTGRADIETSVPFFDHLLTAFSKHSLIDLTVRAHGDTQIDVHHTVEDTGIVFGKALAQALGDKAGISRFGDALVPWTKRSYRPSSTCPVAPTSCTPANLPGLSST